MDSLFKDAPDDEDMIFKQISNGLEIGVAPMIYGYNIKAGIVGDGSYWIDYSIGTSQGEVEDIYSLIITIINKRISEYLMMCVVNGVPCDVRSMASFIFNDFPAQKVKPMYNDHKTFMELSNMCGPNIINIKLPNLGARKVAHVLKNHPSSFEMLANMGTFDDLIED